MLRNQIFDLDSIVNNKQLTPVIVAWSKSAEGAEEFLRKLPLNQVNYLAARGYQMDDGLRDVLVSLQGDLGSSDPRDLGWIHQKVDQAKALATPYLIKALNTNDPEERGHAAYLLGLTADPAAVSALVPLLSDKARVSVHDRFGPRVCDAVARSLETIGTTEAQKALERWRTGAERGPE